MDTGSFILTFIEISRLSGSHGANLLKYVCHQYIFGSRCGVISRSVIIGKNLKVPDGLQTSPIRDAGITTTRWLLFQIKIGTFRLNDL